MHTLSLPQATHEEGNILHMSIAYTLTSIWSDQLVNTIGPLAIMMFGIGYILREHLGP